MNTQSDIIECLRIVRNLALLTLEQGDAEWYNIHRVSEYIEQLEIKESINDTRNR